MKENAGPMGGERANCSRGTPMHALLGAALSLDTVLKPGAGYELGYWHRMF